MEHPNNLKESCVPQIIVNHRKPIVYCALSEILVTTTIPATTKEFVAKKKFRVGVDKNAKVKIARLCDSFRELFLTKVEDPFPGSVLYGRDIIKDSYGLFMFNKLKVYKNTDTSLFEIFTMMKRQPNGEPGVLLNNGPANFFFVYDINGIQRPVFVRWLRRDWHGPGWFIGAKYYKLRDCLDPDMRTFSRNKFETFQV